MASSSRDRPNSHDSGHYLDRPQIVTRNSANHLLLAEFDQWGGNLEKNFTRVLGESFSAELSTDRVSLYPWTPSAPVDFQVTVRVTAFELDPAGDTRLDARWSIVDSKARKILVMARSSYREATRTEGSAIGGAASYQAVAGAMSLTKPPENDINKPSSGDRHTARQSRALKCPPCVGIGARLPSESPPAIIGMRSPTTNVL